MTDFDERIRAGLNDVPAGQPRPLDDIQHRARTVQNRRRAATTGIVLLAAAAVAFPFAASGGGSALRDEQPAPATTESTESQEKVVPCESWEGTTSGRLLDLDEVPDHMRLLWDYSVTEPPSRAYATDWRDAREIILERQPEGCEVQEPAESLSLVQTDGDTVVREIRISPPRTLDGGLEEVGDSRTIDTNAGPITAIEQGDDTTAAYWMAEGGKYWFASVIGSVSDAELADLTESVRFVDGEVDVSHWPGYDESWSIARGGALGDEITVRIEGRIDFSVHQSRGAVDLLRHAMVGDEHIDIDGQQGLLSAEAGRLEFVTEHGAHVVIVARRLTPEDLLAIAHSIERVPADDPRLEAVWETEFDPQSD